MATQIKITQLTDIGSANLAGTTLLPVVNMAGVPTTQKTTLGNLANVILSQSGGNYAAVGTANIAYSVANAAQPNITSVGTLTNVVVSGNANVGILKVSGTSNLGAVGNVTITGGSNGQVLTTNGSNVLSWTTVSGGGNGTPGGNTTEIQFNDAGAFGGNTGFTFNKTTGTLATPLADVSGIANVVGGGATVATKSVLNVASTFGSNDANDPASAQAVRGRVTGSNLTKTRNYVTGVTGQYLITGTNASEFIKAGVLGVVGDQTTTADGAVVAYLDGDGGLTTANAAYAVSMKNSTPNSGFNYGLDLQFIDLNLGGVTTSTFKQADIRFNNGVKLVANTAGNISINGNLMTSAEVVASGVIQSGTGLTTGGYLSVDGNTDLHNTIVTGNLSATGNITASYVLGNGSQLTNIAGANVGGFVPNANIANTAFAVAGANVSGTVANANLSQYLNVSDVNNNFSYHIVLSAGSGDKSLHIDADDNLQYNPSDGTLTATRVDATYVLADLQFSNGYPAANVTGLGNIATINLTGSNSNVLYGNGVFAAVAGGNANTGNVTFDDNIVIGTGDEFGGDGLFLAPGNGSIANSAVQYLRVRGGDAPTHIHLDTGNNQFYDQYFGDDSKYVKLELGEAGNIVVGTDDANGNLYSWSFTSDGNLILAGGNSVIQSIANSSLDTLNPNVSTMVLTPDQNYNSQALVLDPTAPGHIHLRAYAFSNIDDPAANIFLGGEDTAFEVTSGANNQAVIHSNGKAWTFGNDGNISSDTLTFTTTFANVKTVEYQTAGVWDLYVEDGITGSNTASSRLNVSFKDNLIDQPQVYIENTKESDGIALRWTFDENGNLNFPRDVAGNTDPYLKILGGPNPLILSEDASLAGPANLAIITDYLILSGSASEKIAFHADDGEIATDANMVLTTNYSNTGNTYSWTLDTTGNLTLPDTSSVLANVSITLDANDTGNITGLNLIGDSNANLYAHGNVTIVSDSSNTTATWAFGNNGILTLPGGSQISETANTSVNITANANTWAFGVDGNLTVPGSIINDTSIVLSAPAIFNICTIATAGSGYNTGSSLKATTGGSGTGMTVGIGYGLSNQLTSVSVVDPGTGYVNGDVITVSEGTGGTFVITKYNVLANQTNNNTVQTDLIFANNTLTIPVDGNLVGNLIVPGSIVGSGASPAPYISGFSSVSALQFKNGNSNVTVNANSNLWTFDSTGNLTIPGSSGGFIKTVANASIGVAAVDNGTNNPAQLLSLNAGTGAATSIVSAYATNAIIQTNAAGAINTWQFDNAGNLTLPANAFAINYANGTQVSLGGGNVTWAQIDDKAGNSGPTIITLGQNAGFDGQGNAAIAIGKNAGAGGQGASSITIGEDAGGNITQGANSVAIGRSAGFDGQGIGAVAIGSGAGSNTQGNQSVAIGENAGVIQGSTAVAIGQNAGGGVALQGDDAVAIGHGAGSNAQGTQSVAIGLYAGQTTQGTNSIAIGANAGITSQGNNSIILNATGANLNQTTANTFTVSPVRNDTSNIAEVMFYNATSKEVTYGNTINVAGNITGAYILGNGSGLTSLPAPTVTPDISSNGDMSIMTYDGVIRSVNYATVEPSSGNIKGGNISTTGIVTANTANITTGNITTINSGLLQNGNSNITITSNGNVSIQSAGSNVELVVTSTGANVTGTFNATGNISGGNISATGNVSGTYLISTHASANEGGEISLAQPPNGNLSGGITIDAYQNTLRMFEQGGTARGLSIDIANSPAGGGTAIGYRDIPQVGAGNVTLGATDAGKHYYSTTAGNLTLTIPLNSSVPFTTGTAISIVVQAAGNILVNAASGVTLYMAGNSTAANRAVGGYGMATLMKVATDTWFINGTGVA